MTNTAASNAEATRIHRQQQFEYAIRELWNKNPNTGKFDLSPLIINGKFNRYMDADTDNAWIGFQLAKVFDARVQTGQIDPTKLE